MKLIFMFFLIGFMSNAFGIETEKEIIQLMNNYKIVPAEKFDARSSKGNCRKEEDWKAAPFHNGWDCKIIENVDKVAWYEYANSGYVDRVDIGINICKNLSSEKLKKCHLDFIKNFTKNKNVQVKGVYGNAIISKNDKYNIVAIAYPEMSFAMIRVSYVRKEDPDERELIELSKYLSHQVQMTGHSLSRGDFDFIFSDKSLQKDNPKYYRFIKSPGENEYEKVLITLLTDKKYMWEKIVSKMKTQ